MAVAISPYLVDPEQGVVLRNGASVRVRAIRPDDEPRLMALCRRFCSFDRPASPTSAVSGASTATRTTRTR